MDRTKNIKEYLEDDFKKFIFEGIRVFSMVGIQFFTGSDSVQVNFQKDPKLWLPVLHDEANCRAAQVLHVVEVGKDGQVRYSLQAYLLDERVSAHW